MEDLHRWGTRVITAIIALGIFLPLLYDGGIWPYEHYFFIITVGIYEFFQMKKMNIFSIEGVSNVTSQHCHFYFHKDR